MPVKAGCIHGASSVMRTSFSSAPYGFFFSAGTWISSQPCTTRLSQWPLAWLIWTEDVTRATLHRIHLGRRHINPSSWNETHPVVPAKSPTKQFTGFLILTTGDGSIEAGTIDLMLLFLRRVHNAHLVGGACGPGRQVDVLVGIQVAAGSE